MKKSELKELCEMMFPDYPDIVTVAQLQRMLSISRHLVYDLIGGRSDSKGMTAMTQMTAISLYRKKRHSRHYRHKEQKERCFFMRNRTMGINVRGTAEEKAKLSENANYCGLSLSDYLRKLGLGKEVKAAQREKDYLIFRQIEALKAEISRLTSTEITEKLTQIQKALR